MSFSADRAPRRVKRMQVRKKCTACSNLGTSDAYQTILPGVHNEIYQIEFKCEHCGHAANEVRRDGVSKLGRRYELQVREPEDLDRFLLHAPSCKIEVEQIELEFEGGATSGTFLRVRDLLAGIAVDLRQHASVISSDLSGAESRAALNAFLERLGALEKPENLPWVLKFSDPLGLSYIGLRGSHSLADDDALVAEDFERTFDDEERHQIDFETIDENHIGVDEMHLVTLEHEPADPQVFPEPSEDGEATKVTGVELATGATDDANAANGDDDDDDLPPLVEEAGDVLLQG